MSIRSSRRLGGRAPCPVSVARAPAVAPVMAQAVQRALWCVAAAAVSAAPAAARPAAKPAQPDAGTRLIAGTWASVNGAERLVFQADGQVRSCFANGQRGNAAIGRWRRVGDGRYVVEFTHTAAPDCRQPAQPIRRHPASIVGQAQVRPGELALFVSGEFPPDLYRPVAP